jgi:hypothetical protein
MRVFTLILSAVFVAIGIAAATTGDADGFLIAGFFGFCLLIALFEPWLPQARFESEYELVITEDELACVHRPRRRAREAIRWNAVERIWYVTTSKGPWVPDEWILLEGESGGCSFPTEARGMEGMWDELKQRFPDFDYGPLIRGGTEDARQLCWERQRAARGS